MKRAKRSITTRPSRVTMNPPDEERSSKGDWRCLTRRGRESFLFRPLAGFLQAEQLGRGFEIGRRLGIEIAVVDLKKRGTTRPSPVGLLSCLATRGSSAATTRDRGRTVTLQIAAINHERLRLGVLRLIDGVESSASIQHCSIHLPGDRKVSREQRSGSGEIACSSWHRKWRDQSWRATGAEAPSRSASRGSRLRRTRREACRCASRIEPLNVRPCLGTGPFHQEQRRPWNAQIEESGDQDSTATVSFSSPRGCRRGRGRPRI